MQISDISFNHEYVSSLQYIRLQSSVLMSHLKVFLSTGFPYPKWVSFYIIIKWAHDWMLLSSLCQRTIPNVPQLSESNLSKLHPQSLSSPCWLQCWPECLPHSQQSPGDWPSEPLSWFRLSSPGLAGPGGEMHVKHFAGAAACGRDSVSVRWGDNDDGKDLAEPCQGLRPERTPQRFICQNSALRPYVESLYGRVALFSFSKT